MKKILFLIFLLATGAIYYFFGFPWKYFEAKSEYSVYLENKYKQKPVFDSFQYHFFQKSYSGKVYFEKTPEILFSITTNTHTKFIEDDYEEKLPHLKAIKELRPFVHKLFPERVDDIIEMINEEEKEVRITIILKNEPSAEEHMLFAKLVRDAGYKMQWVIDIKE